MGSTLRWSPPKIPHVKKQTGTKKLGLRASLAAAAIVGAMTVSARKADEISADPTGEKDCGPVLPPDASANTLTLPAPPASLPWIQKGGVLNDASCLNRTPVYGVVKVTEERHIREALQFARDNGLKVSIAGVRHSMGGHAVGKNALVLNMLDFNSMSLDDATKTLTVQSGATWHDIQKFLHPKYAVKAMQSTDIFTVGGSIAVNAHGMDHQAGAVGRTIRSMRLMRADGAVQTLSRSENAELFNLVIGGYGLFGVVLDAQIEITENVLYATGRRVVDYAAFPALFRDELAPDPKLGLFYGHLSTSPDDSLLREMLLYTYHEAEPAVAAQSAVAPLGEVASTRLRRFVLNFSKLGSVPMRLKWLAEKYVEPRMESCTVISRNNAQASGEACLVSRNDPMHDSVFYLRNGLKTETDILQEYFIPREKFAPFVDGLRDIVRRQGVNLVNASVRVVHKEDNLLNYAPADAFSIVLYVNQPTTEAGNAHMMAVTRELVDLTTSLNGRFFLPYQLHYTPQQLERAYPEIRGFVAAKRSHDPDAIFSSIFYERLTAGLGE